MKLKILKKSVAERKTRKSKRVRFCQDLIPIKKWNSEGNVYSLDDGSFMKVFRVQNINYRTLSKDMRMDRIQKWINVLNTFEPAVGYKYTIMKRVIDDEDFRKDKLLPLIGDGKDDLRNEYNLWVMESNRKSSRITEDCFMQINIANKKEASDAAHAIDNYQKNLYSELIGMGSSLNSVYRDEYLEALYNFLHQGDIQFFKEIDIESFLRSKHGINDLISPSKISVNAHGDYIEIDGIYMRALYIPPNGYAKYIQDDIIYELTEKDRNFCLSVDIMPVPIDEATSLVDSNAGKVEFNITQWQERQNKHNNFSAQIPYSMRKQRETLEEWNKDLHEDDQRLFLASVTMLIAASTVKELDASTEELTSIARKNGCKMASLTLEQKKGMITAMPFGKNCFLTEKGEKLRSLSSSGLAAFIPFTVPEVSQPGGKLYGRNAISGRGIFINRKMGKNGNAFYYGSSGSGKSFLKKKEMLSYMLNSKDNIVIVDPEREYVDLVRAVGGTVINLSPTSTTHINAMDIAKGTGEDKNPLIMKTEFMLSLYAAICKRGDIAPEAMTVIDQAVARTYEKLIKNKYKGEMPTLVDFVNALKKQEDELADNIAKAFGIFTTGSLNTFAHQTNVDMSNRIICFDTNELGAHLQPIGMIVIMDYISNTLMRNREEKVSTWVDIDEIYLLFMLQATAVFIDKLSRRIRKYGGFLTGITQKISDAVKSEAGASMMTNSEFIIITSLNDADAAIVSDLLGLTEEQLKYVKNVGRGKGIIKLGSAIIPFEDEFPKDTKLYEMMDTSNKESRDVGAN